MSLTQINKAGLDEIALDHVFTIGASGSSAYTFQGEGLNGTVNNPTLYLTRGKTYRFENGSGGHPIRIQSTSGASGTAYNTGVTNNAGSGTVIVEVQHDAPDVLYYQCTSHAAMKGILYITGALADGGVTTAKIADDAVNNDKLANSVVAEIAANTAKTSLENNSVTTAKIADEAVTLAKLPHGTSSNDGKFLRANNGADPTFESIPAGVTINNNADNRVITGSGGTTLNGESSLLFDGSKLLLGTTTSAAGSLVVKDTAGNQVWIVGRSSDDTAAVSFRNNADDAYRGRIEVDDSNGMAFQVGSSERVRIDTAGKVGINETSPQQTLHVHNDTAYQGILINGNGAPRVGFARSTTTTGEWSVGIDGTNGNDFAITQSNDNSNRKLIISSAATTASGALVAGGSCTAYDNFIVATSGKGLSFAATSDASGMTSEVLDDYEEGSFSPNFNMTSSSPNITYYDQQGQYTKVGRVVHFQIYLRINVVNSNGSGILFVDGLPYTPVSNTGQGPAFGCVSFGYMDNIHGMNGTDSPVGYVEANATRIYLYLFPDNSGHAVNMTVANNLGNNSKMMMAGSYQV